MTEQEWLEGVETQGARVQRLSSLEITLGISLSPRKLRLYAIACARRIWHHFDPQARKTIEVTERFADGLARKADFRAASKEAWRVAIRQEKEQSILPSGRDDSPDDCARSVASWTSDPEISGSDADCAADTARIAAVDHSLYVTDNEAYWKAFDRELEIHANLSREIFGNPFHPVAVNPAWRTPAILALAQAAYDNRTLPAGTLEPNRLAILADALEDAGCDNAELLAHLRGQGPHVRGCFAVDLILDKK